MREWCECLHRQVYTCACPKNLRDKIERLGAENGQLRAANERLLRALEHYACRCADDACEAGNRGDVSCGHTARAALAQKRDASGVKFHLGDRVRKTSGSSWQGVVVGTYSTNLTPEGYCVESEREPGSVQIYPAKALELAARAALAEQEKKR